MLRTSKLKAALVMLPSTIWYLTRTTVAEWWRDNALRLSAALSYYITLSLAPLLLIVIAVMGFLMGNDSARDAMMLQLRMMVGDTSAEAIEVMLRSAQRPSSGIFAATIGIIMLLLAATGVVGQLQDALNTIWEVKPRPGRRIRGIIRSRIVSFAMILAVGFLLLVSLVFSAAVEALAVFWQGQTEVIVKTLHFLFSISITTVLFALMFKFLPDVRLKWRNVWFGAVVTAILFTIGKELTAIYIAKSSLASSYGAAGSIVILLTWVYYSCACFLLGAEFTQALTNFREGQPPKKPGITAKPKEAT
jgi:membrane protein